MQFTWRPKGVIGDVVFTLLIAGPFGYFGLTLLNDARTRILGLILLGAMSLMVGSIAWRVIQLVVQRRRPRNQNGEQPPKQRAGRASASDILTRGLFIVVLGGFGAVFVTYREWVPATFTLAGAALFVFSLVVRLLRPEVKTQPADPNQPQTLITPLQAMLWSTVLIAPALWGAATGQWLGALFFGLLCVPLFAMAGVKVKEREQLARTHLYRVVLFTSPFILGPVIISAATEEWEGILITGVVSLLTIIIVAVVLVERRLGPRMRAPLSAADVAPLPAPVHTVKLQAATPILPIPHFAVTVFKSGYAPQPAEMTKTFIEQRQQRIDTTILVYRRGANFLWVWLAGILLLVFISHGTWQPYSSSWFTTFSFLQFLMLFKVSSWMQKVARMYGWMALGGLWLVSIVFVASFSLLRLVLAGVQLWTVVTASIAGVSVKLTGFEALSLGWAITTNVTIVLLAALSLFFFWKKIRRETEEAARTLQTDRSLKLLFLWVFGSDAVGTTLMQHVGALWGLLGSMQVLCGRGYMGGLNELVPAFFNKKRDPLVETPEELRAKLSSFKYAPHWTGRYFTNSLLCHDRVWQDALDTLLDDAAVVLMSLSGFSAENDGCVYELGQLIDRVATQRFLLLTDDTTDMDALQAALRQAWEAMAATSPNRTAAGPIQVYPVQWLRIKPLDRDREDTLTAQEQAFEATRVHGVQIEIEQIVSLLCEGAIQPTAPSSLATLATIDLSRSPNTRISQ